MVKETKTETKATELEIQEARVTLETNMGKVTYKLTETSPAVKNAKGRVSMVHLQPAEGSKVLMQYGKVYVDTVALVQRFKEAKKASKS